MEQKSIHEIYRMVCDTPSGVGFHVDYMPEFFDYDTMDNSKPHVHTFYEIIWFKSSGGVHTVDFQNYNVRENTIFFLAPGQVHHFDQETRHKGVLIKFCTDFLKAENKEEDLFIRYDMFNDFEAAPICKLDEDIVPLLDSLVTLMEKEQNKDNNFGHLDYLRSLVRIFIINVRRHSTRSDSNPLLETKASHKLYLKFLHLLEKEHIRLHTVKEYADRLNISTKTLSNSVMECTGKSPLTIINDRTIIEAKRLLSFSDMMVKEIADYLGYDDPSYFVKFFKRKTGWLPNDFRQSQKISCEHC